METLQGFFQTILAFLLRLLELIVGFIIQMLNLALEFVRTIVGMLP